MKLVAFALLVACRAAEEPGPVVPFDEQPSSRDTVGDLRAYASAIADLDGDGTQELAAAGFATTGAGRRATVFVYRKVGDAWKPVTEGGWLGGGGGGGATIRNIEVADLDGDGRPEVIALGRVGMRQKEASARLVVLALRDGALHEVSRVEWNLGVYTHGYGLAIGDVDGDAKPDIVTTGFAFDGTRERGFVRVWSPALELRNEALLPGTDSVRISDVAIGDLDGDGRNEIVTAGRRGEYRADGTNGTLADRRETGDLAVFDGKTLALRARTSWLEGSTLRLRAVAVTDHRIVAGGQFDADGKPCLAVFDFAFSELALRTHTVVEGRGEIRRVLVSDKKIAATLVGEERPARRNAMSTWELADDGLHRVVAATPPVIGPDGSVVAVAE